MFRRVFQPQPRRPAPFQHSDKAFDDLVTTYQSRVFCLCYRLLGDAADAEDAAQETFLRAYLHRHRYDPACPLTTWLLTIANHYCIDRLRQRHWRSVGLEEEGCADQPDLHDRTIGPEAAALQAERRRELLGQILLLTPRDRDVILLRYWGYLSHVEIAAAMGSTVSAVKSRLHSARLRLGAQLRKGPAPVLERRDAEWLLTI